MSKTFVSCLWENAKSSLPANVDKIEQAEFKTFRWRVASAQKPKFNKPLEDKSTILFSKNGIREKDNFDSYGVMEVG